SPCCIYAPGGIYPCLRCHAGTGSVCSCCFGLIDICNNSYRRQILELCSDLLVCIVYIIWLNDLPYQSLGTEVEKFYIGHCFCQRRNRDRCDILSIFCLYSAVYWNEIKELGDHALSFYFLDQRIDFCLCHVQFCL